ncbi:MAG TPA: bifunctional 4-hydroxy-2-oxoglutarate aldolase/2-dehydro-3-deoxy-phosphogluconate aldolase [Candidatus Limnocylindrales bacterium]|nr:bifunctional 4-hydroxy-2-oxoglutarate aldolase/2-dehydro-3-deoxy-phosphogluconate aldolase [Candidatus Limnocylindrales bacterium]
MAFEGIRPELPPGLREGGVVAIARRVSPDRLEAIADGLLRGGVRAFEVTLNDPEADALAAIRIVARHAEQTELVIGAGTVLSIDAAARALDAGARFLVMPHTDPDLVAWAASRGVPSFPGAMTPTEILRAWRAGAAAVKLFPASVVGPTFIREFRGPLPDIPLIPTGGVTLETIDGLVRAGALAVGLGSWLIGDADAVGIAERGGQAVRTVAQARAGR